MIHHGLKRTRTLVCLLILSLFPLAAHQASEYVDVSVLKSDREGIILEFSLKDYVLDTKKAQGGGYALVSLPGEGLIMKKGEPELPTVVRSVVIPDQAKMSWRVLDETWSTEQGIIVRPSKGHLTRDMDPTKIPYVFGPVYCRDGAYPDHTVMLHEPFILRDLRGINIQFNPFQYEPGRQALRILRKMTVEIFLDGPGDINIKTEHRGSGSFGPAFTRVYKDLFINFDQAMSGFSTSDEGKILVVTHESFADAMQPFINWKASRGNPITMVNMSEIGSSATELKNYFQSQYDSADPFTFVVLVGDSAQIPIYRGSVENAASDPSYMLLEGNDHYPDAFISRISVRNVEEVSLQIQKFINYESGMNVMVTQPWYDRGCGIASNEGSWSGLTDSERCDILRDKLLGYTYNHVDQIYQGQGGSTSGIRDAINDGRSIVNYIGHGSGTSWGSVYFHNSHVEALENYHMLPFIVDVACQNGDFARSTCFAEAWLRANQGGVPTGAVAMYSASTNAAWIPPCVMQKEVVDQFIAEEMMTIGEIYFAGAIKTLETYPGQEGKQVMEQYNIFGDCSMMIHAGGSTSSTAYIYTAPGPGEGNAPEIRSFDADGAMVDHFPAYNTEHFGARLATGYLLGSDTSFIVTGPGPGPSYGPLVRGFSIDGTPFPGSQFLAYGVKKYGATVSLGDIDGDGRDEILTAPGPGTGFGPHIRGWNVDHGGVTPISAVSFLPFNTRKGGAEVAAGDIDGDGYDEILVAPGQMRAFGSHLKGFDYDGSVLTALPGLNYFAYSGLKFGLNVATGNLDGGVSEEIITAPGPGPFYGAFIRGWRYDGSDGPDGKVMPLNGFSFFAYAQGMRYGAAIGCGLYPGERSQHLLYTAPGPGKANAAHIRGWSYEGGSAQTIPGVNFFAYDSYGFGGRVTGVK